MRRRGLSEGKGAQEGVGLHQGKGAVSENKAQKAGPLLSQLSLLSPNHAHLPTLPSLLESPNSAGFAGIITVWGSLCRRTLPSQPLLNSAPGDLISSAHFHSSSNLFSPPAGGLLSSIFSSLPSIHPSLQGPPHPYLVPSWR